MQHFIVLYDISHDRIRGKVACACEDYGLDRIQYSAFYGLLTRTHQKELHQRVKQLLGDEVGRVLFIPVADEQWQRRLQVGEEVDR